MEFSASVGFIHKESVTIHGHTIIKKNSVMYSLNITLPTNALIVSHLF